MTQLGLANRLRLRSVSRTHAGAVRTSNEDRILDRPDAGMWAVADGMGGHAGGGEAASRLVEALGEVSHGSSAYACLADMIDAIERVNESLCEERSSRRISGSTIVALLAHDRHYACVWAGDSRAYLYRSGSLSRITRDHSVVQDLVDGGMVAEAERGLHAQAHVVTRAVGASRRLELEQRFAPIQDNDILLLCSDGLVNVVDEAEIAETLKQPCLHKLADDLLAKALDRSASDNISFVIVEARDAD